MTDGKIKLTSLWQRRSARTGKTYFSGYLGAAKVVLLKDEYAEVPDGADGIWTVFIEEAPPRQQPGKPPLIEMQPSVPTGGKIATGPTQLPLGAGGGRATRRTDQPFHDDDLDGVLP